MTGWVQFNRMTKAKAFALRIARSGTVVPGSGVRIYVWQARFTVVWQAVESA